MHRVTLIVALGALYSIAWVDEEDSRWYDQDLPAIAREHHLNIVASNWTVPGEPDWVGFGQTRVINSTGEILAKTEDDSAETVVYADVSLR
ncbi:hypothetical protein ACFL6C_00050 [Myxococcota bacterium]